MTTTHTDDTRELDAYVRERALNTVVINLAPAPFLMVPFVLLVGTVLRNETSPVRIGWWTIAAVIATAINLTALGAYKKHRENTPGQPAGRAITFMLGAGVTALGTFLGMSPWAAADGPLELVLLFLLFPATASAVGCIVTAGRRDFYLAYLVPLVILSAASLYTADDQRLRPLSLMAAFFGAGLMLLHHVVSRGSIEAYRLQWQSDQLLAQLDEERAELTSLNEQLAGTNTRLAHQATHDPLTGLYNRRGTLDLLDQMLAEADEEHPLGVLFCDLDHFKAVNDALGHRGGDRFISIIADRLQRSIEPTSVAGRMGGDEFVVVMPGMDITDATNVGHRLVGMLAQPVYAEGRDVPSSVSIGVAAYPANAASASELLRHANAALYRAKSSGRNRVEIFDDSMREELEAQLEGEQALRRAIDDGEIVAFFQPEVDALTGDVVGAELLARWVRPSGEVVAASDFLAAAQSASLLERITDRVLISARPHIRRFVTLGLPEGFRFRVNMAPEATERSWRDDPIGQMLAGIDPNVITIDVREASVQGDLMSAAANLAQFRISGGRVCLDDFARGISSLSLLRHLPLDEVRIDRIAFDKIDSHPHDRAIVRSIINLTHEIGLQVTADGVEDGLQGDALMALGCVRQQGHLYAPALPPREFEDLLLDRMAHRFARAHHNPTWATDALDPETASDGSTSDSSRD